MQDTKRVEVRKKRMYKCKRKNVGTVLDPQKGTLSNGQTEMRKTILKKAWIIKEIDQIHDTEERAYVF